MNCNIFAVTTLEGAKGRLPVLATFVYLKEVYKQPRRKLLEAYLEYSLVSLMHTHGHMQCNHCDLSRTVFQRPKCK